MKANKEREADELPIPLIDLKAQYESIRHEIDHAVSTVLENGAFILGPNVTALEKEVADYIGVKHAVGVASGTDALLLSLRAMGVGPGDEVALPALTFFATAEVVMLLGATPVLVDVDPETCCIDVKHLEKKITERTKAILPVHLFGHPADMDPILTLAQSHGLKVVEDNAQAIGATYKGRMTGSLGHAGCLSFFPSKNLGAYGDGGMVVTNDTTLAEQLRMLRTHGWTQKYYSQMVGYNSRLDELQAAILRVKLQHLDSWNDSRRRLAMAYTLEMANLNLGLPSEMEYARHVYHVYVIQSRDREGIAKKLNDAGISTSVYYPHPLHMVPATENLGFQKGDFPVAEAISEKCLAIPLYPEMNKNQIDLVVKCLQEITSS